METQTSRDLRIRKRCALCQSPSLSDVARLDPSPLANEFATEKTQIPTETFPLTLLVCAACEHVQLKEIIAPERLFRNYVYVSGTSPSFVKHFEEFANNTWKNLDLEPADLIVEIGSNDGTLLKIFQALGSRNVLGIDPATKIAEKAIAEGVPTVSDFFSTEVASRIRDICGSASLVIANNVFAHTENLRDVRDGVSALLKIDGVFSFEVSYLPSVIKNNLFDTIYHEHLAYHTIGPLIPFLGEAGLRITDARKISTHGGSIRITAVKTASPVMENYVLARLPSYVLDLIATEDSLNIPNRLDGPMPWATFFINICRRGEELRAAIKDCVSKGKKIAGYGAPAKLTTLMSTFKLDPLDFEYIVDDSALKQGMFTPYGNIPVKSREALTETPVDVIVLFAWNFAEQLVPTLRRYADVIVPLPIVSKFSKL